MLVAVTLSVGAVAQAAPTLPREARYVHGWTEPRPPLGFSVLRAHGCRLGDDDRLDVAILRSQEDVPGTMGRKLVYLPDAGRVHACVPLGPAQDFVVLPDAGGNGRDGLLALQIDGSLVLYVCPPGQQMPVEQRLGIWPGARRLWAVRNGSTTEVFALDVAGVRMRRATWFGQGFGAVTISNWLPGTSNVQGMDWEGDGTLELVVAAGAVAMVQRWNLLPVVNIPIGTLAPPGAQPMVQVSRSAAHGDLLVTYVSDGTNTVLSWANAAASGLLGLGTLAASAIAAYDRDGDGDEDIVLADAARSELHVLLRQGNQFVRQSVPLLAGTAAPTGRLTAVVGGDLDGDGDGDLMTWNAGTILTHTFLDGWIGNRRPLAAHGDLQNATIGAATTIPITVALPSGLAGMALPGETLRIRFDGWLVDPQTGLVVPQRVLAQETGVAPSTGVQTVPVTFPVPAHAFFGFLLQLHVGIVAVRADGTRRSLPSLLLCLTPDAAREEQTRREVYVELTGNHPAGLPDGGGDGNIGATKTTRHEIGRPPF